VSRAQRASGAAGVTAAVAIAIAALTGLSIACASPAAGATTARDPATMVLQLRDLPRGFTESGRRDRANRAVAKETGVRLATLQSWGRIGGHEATYDRVVDPKNPPSGAASVIAFVSLYRSADGLRKAFAASTARIARTGRPKHEQIPLGSRLGDDARMWETRFTQDGVEVVLYTIAWRSRGALASLSVAGVAGKLRPGGALWLARRQQARIVASAKAAPAAGPVA
jgi:hypothetical protein